MGFFDSIQEHGWVSVFLAIGLVAVNIFFSNRSLNRSLQIETITKARNENIEKIRTLIAENLQKSYKVKDTVYGIYNAREACVKNQDCNNNFKSFHQPKTDYYSSLYDSKYSYDLLMIYIKSIDPLMDTSKMEKLFDDLMRSMTISINNIEFESDLQKRKDARYKYNNDYKDNSTSVKNEAADFIKHWLEESYSEVLGKSRYSKLKN
ncbi:hypothetical protein ETI03_00080 [Macrococcoides canis]|uniref:hypothetical protein n=1 Tax=Macrococcoides canis TaxID=1855823 RepID=UPI00105E86E6|nr:hypothetical protein [Macrococcus canis]TDM32127.1 hypothetical protein ETI03_00080 [Macrococcus canis]